MKGRGTRKRKTTQTATSSLQNSMKRRKPLSEAGENCPPEENNKNTAQMPQNSVTNPTSTQPSLVLSPPHIVKTYVRKKPMATVKSLSYIALSSHPSLNHSFLPTSMLSTDCASPTLPLQTPPPSSPSSSSVSLPAMSPRSLQATKQLFQDMGQKSSTTSCKVCGMHYSAGIPQEEMTHRRFHQSFAKLLKWGKYKDEELVVKEFADGSRILRVTSDSKPQLRKRAEQVQTMVDKELGFAVSPNNNRETTQIYIYISRDKILGCVVAEAISRAFRLRDTTTTTSPVIVQKDMVPARVGISRVWVCGEARRKGVATKLVDVVRANFIVGQFVDLDNCAFSPPSLDGIRFASSYNKTPYFLVYMD